MKTENRVKKVDYKELSDVRCKVCGCRLKKNSKIKGHTQCYICFKVSQGKYTANKYEVVNGVKTNKILSVRDFKKEQSKNIRRYKHDRS